MPLRNVSQRSDLFDLLAANSETQLFAFLSGTTSGPQFLGSAARIIYVGLNSQRRCHWAPTGEVGALKSYQTR